MLKFTKIQGYDVKSPKRAYQTDAGIDFYIPKFNDVFIKEFLKWNIENNDTFERQRLEDMLIKEKKITIFPQEHVIIPTGIKVIVPEGHALIAHDKSGRATKNKLHVVAGVIDYGYIGNILVMLWNLSKNYFVDLYEDEKFVQFILLKLGSPFIQELTEEEYNKEIQNLKSERFEGGFGSTGIK